MILFGIFARGDDTFEGDIDILIETDDKEPVESIVNLNEYIEGRKLSATILSPGEFRAMREKDRPFYEIMMQGMEPFRRDPVNFS